MEIPLCQHIICQHPEHNIQVGRKATKIRTIPLKTLETFNKENSPLPIGSAFCFRHLKSITAKDDDEADPEPTTPIKSSTPADDNYVPDTAIISNKTLEEATTIANSLCHNETLEEAKTIANSLDKPTIFSNKTKTH